MLLLRRCSLRLPFSHRPPALHQGIATGQCQSFSRTSEIIQEGDRALLQYRDDDPFLTPKLERNGTVNTRWGSLPHETLLGKAAREVVTTTKGRRLGVRQPTLSEYVTLTPRLVTPIYPADANFITSLFDIHPSVEESSEDSTSDETMQILEAGTGHGALTLHLARAMSGANHRVPKQQHNPISVGKRTMSFWQRLLCQIRGSARAESPMPQGQGMFRRTGQSAVLHTIDISHKHSEHAKKVVHGFRRGLYFDDVKFHVGNVSDWVNERLEGRRKDGFDADSIPFLDHAFLDLPNSHRHLQTVSSALRTNGNLIVLNPSITQITEGVEIVKERGLPLTLDRVLELGPNITGGKEWDVRLARPKKIDLPQCPTLTKVEGRPAGAADPMKAKAEAETDSSGVEVEGQVSQSKNWTEEKDEGWAMVCRPKVGVRVTGGAFIGVWKKMRVNPQRPARDG